MLRSPNFEDHPKLYMNYFADLNDLRTMIEGIRMVSRDSYFWEDGKIIE